MYVCMYVVYIYKCIYMRICAYDDLYNMHLPTPLSFFHTLVPKPLQLQ